MMQEVGEQSRDTCGNVQAGFVQAASEIMYSNPSNLTVSSKKDGICMFSKVKKVVRVIS